MLNVIVLSVAFYYCYADCHYAEYRYAEYRYAALQLHLNILTKSNIFEHVWPCLQLLQ
jgi:hypothetical protein